MNKRWLLLALALLALLGVNLRPAYRVSVAGQTLPGLYAPLQVRRCADLARRTAEEILENSVPAPTMQRSLRLRLGPADGDGPALTDALLRSIPGIGVSDAVLVNGTRLGTVADGQQLCEELRRSILMQMPNAAVLGRLGGRLELRRVYTRADSDTPDSDMILLITGMAPVVYVDANGRLA